MKNIFVMALLSVSIFFTQTKIYSYETDQYSSMFHDIPDSIEIVDEAVNKAIENAVLYYEGEPDEEKFVNLIKKSLNARQLEKWVNDHKQIASWNNLSDSIYKTVAWFNSPIIRFKGLANTFNLNGVHVGADKMSHFFGVGGIYFQKAEVDGKEWSEEKKIKKITKYGRWTEKLQWGELTTNVFSNADLVVNYEGYLFYKSLFRENIIKGKSPILKWVNGKPVVLRKFTFSDHVNDFWSEALLPSWYQISLRRRVLGVLRTYCLRPDYLIDTSRFEARNELELYAKYSQLRINWKAQKFKLNTVCEKFFGWSENHQQRYLVKQEKRIERMSHKLSGKKVPVEQQIEDLSSFESIKAVIGSPLPGCNKHIAGAVREHEVIEEWNEGINFVIDNFVIEKYGIDFENQESVFKIYLSSLKEIENKLNISNRSIENINENKIVTSYKINNDLGEEISNLRYSIEVDGKTMKVCFISKVPLLDRIDNPRSEDMEVYLNNCQERNYESQTLKTSKQYMTVKPGRTFWSDDNFYSMKDKLGYVYRNVPYLCKWY
tara:strand:+ start:31903 stop:33543 length:1641 start_codon:yes stop_codon:yes gene_type:complete